MRSAVLAAVVAVCCAVLLGGADAKAINDPGTLKVGTVLYHATADAAGETDFRLARSSHSPFIVTQSADENLPSSPAWFAPSASPTVSLHAATYDAFQKWSVTAPRPQNPPQINIYKYRTLKAMSLQQYENEHQASENVGGRVFDMKKQNRPGLFGDSKRAAARYFCSDLAAPKSVFHGYLVKKTLLRKELEYVLCKAHDPEYLQFVSKEQCVMRATRSKVEGATQPVIWVWCDEVNKVRWYKWDLNGQDWRQIMAQFKKAGLTDRPRRYPQLTRFREMLTKGKKSKGAVQPAAGDEDDQKFIKSPIGKAEMALLKQAAEKIKEAAKSLKPEEVPL